MSRAKCIICGKTLPEDGQEATPGLTSQEIRDALQPVKGIGAKRLDSIVEALDAALQEKGKAGEKI